MPPSNRRGPKDTVRLIKPKKSASIFAWGAVLLGLGVLSGLAAGCGWGPDAGQALPLAGIVLSVIGAVLLLVAIARVLRNLDDIAAFFFRQQQAAQQRQPPVHTSELPKVRAARKPVKS